MAAPSTDFTCAAANLRRASRAVCRLYDLVLKPARLKTTQFIILAAIADADEIAHCDLAQRFAASEETFSRRLASARKAGWVRMEVGIRGRRVYRLSDSGKAILQNARPYWQAAQDRLLHELGEADWHMLADFADRVTSAASRAEETPLRNGGAHGVLTSVFRQTASLPSCYCNPHDS